MPGLEPKPNPEGELWGWNDLNRALQSTFKRQTKSKQSFRIAVDSYQMSKEEMITELEANGYKVTDKGNVLVVE